MRKSRPVRLKAPTSTGGYWIWFRSTGTPQRFDSPRLWNVEPGSEPTTFPTVKAAEAAIMANIAADPAKPKAWWNEPSEYLIAPAGKRPSRAERGITPHTGAKRTDAAS